MCFCFVLTGCSLFETNWDKYYNQTVVSIEYPDGDAIEINKKELVVAFNNYGAQLINSGSSYEDALNKTITALINQKVLIKDSEDKVQLSNLERNNIWKDSYDSVFANMEEYISDIKKEWDIADVEEDLPEQEESTAYKPFEPAATIVFENGEYVIKLVEEVKEDENAELIVDSEDTDVIVDSIYESVIAKTVEKEDMSEYEKQTARINKEAVKRYIKLLIASEKGQKLSTKEDEVLKREIKRIYQNTYESAIITNMQEYISYSSNLSKITVNDIFEKYKSMILESMTKYSLTPDSFSEDMLSSFADVNYVANDEYFFVSHILLKFNDEQQARYDELEDLRDKGFISQEYYNQQIENLVNEIKAVEKDEQGNVVENSNKTAEDVLKEINSALETAITDEDKNNAFKELLYKYNQDPGALNSEYLYVIGKNDSKMVESFTQASRDLDKAGKYGAVSGLVPSEYGVHIIYYAGKVENTFNFANADDVKFNTLDNQKLSEDINVLCNTLLNPLHNKTLFDKVYEQLSETTSSEHEAMYINVLKKDLKITKYTSAYKDLLD